MTDAPTRGPWSPGSFLTGLSADRERALLALGVRRTLPSGRVLFRQGDPDTTHIEILLRGYVKVTTVEEGVESLLSVRGPGDLLGETATLTGSPRTATVRASGPVVAVVITRADFRRFLDRHPDVAVMMAATMASRLRWANRRRSEFTAYSADVRLARLLLDLGATYGEPVPEGIRLGALLSQPELATMVGIAEATAQKAFSDLRRRGIIKTGYRRIVILDLDALRAISESG
jgi:CRP/FNR family cyclic AMP-dependent transcriptional regulator